MECPARAWATPCAAKSLSAIFPGRLPIWPVVGRWSPTGGFSLISEAVFLHKPECTIPISAQFEQWLNAAEVEQIGYGRHFAKITVNNLRAFFYGVVGFDTAQAGYPQQGNEVLFAELDATLKEIIAEHLPAEVELQETSWGGE